MLETLLLFLAFLVGLIVVVVGTAYAALMVTLILTKKLWEDPDDD